MVTKGDILYFAPGIRFNQIDLNGPTLPEQFNCRITGYYIKPAEECCERGQAFAAGVLLVSCIDALARFKFKTNDVGKRFKDFVQEELPSFSNKELAKHFYQDFRNGLIHETRIKRGGQFSLEGKQTLEEIEGLLRVNPFYLAEEVRVALGKYVGLLSRDVTERTSFVKALRRDHSDDFRLAGL